ncbi:MAG: hypothetical protein LIV24_06960 [Eubacterium sp.]|nr:hypothetical protein [Eubacterium sp.]
MNSLKKYKICACSAALLALADVIVIILDTKVAFSVTAAYICFTLLLVSPFAGLVLSILSWVFLGKVQAETGEKRPWHRLAIIALLLLYGIYAAAVLLLVISGISIF